MPDLRNKARKQEETARIEDYHNRRSHGWTVFHFNLNPSATYRHLWPGEAARLLLKLTGHRLSYWRCPSRGLAIKYRRLPTGPHDKARTSTRPVFSTIADPVEAKKELVIDMLYRGLELYRALPNKLYEREVQLMRELLTAPPHIDRAEWLRVKHKLDPSSRHLLHSHEADLRKHLLGQGAGKHAGTVAISVPVEAK